LARIFTRLIHGRTGYLDEQKRVNTSKVVFDRGVSEESLRYEGIAPVLLVLASARDETTQSAISNEDAPRFSSLPF